MFPEIYLLEYIRNVEGTLQKLLITVGKIRDNLIFPTVMEKVFDSEQL